MKSVREMRTLPVRVTGRGEIFIGDEQILADYPIIEDGISVQPWRGRFNRLTITLLVGPVSLEVKKPDVDQ
jgi:hypothetical protein